MFIEFLFIINFFLSRQDHGKRVGTHTPGSFSHATNQYNPHVTIYNIVLYIYNIYSYIVYNVTIVLNVTVVIVTFNTMLRFIQCYEIICNYYTMYRTLYYTYGQGSLLLGISTLRGIGHSRQGCTKNNIDYPQPCVHLAVTSCVIPMPDSVLYNQPNDPFCFSEYISRCKNRFLNLANMNGGNPRPERMFVYAPWGVFYPITYYANRFMSGQYKDVVKVKFDD